MLIPSDLVLSFFLLNFCIYTWVWVEPILNMDN